MRAAAVGTVVRPEAPLCFAGFSFLPLDWNRRQGLFWDCEQKVGRYRMTIEEILEDKEWRGMEEILVWKKLFEVDLVV